MKLAELLKGVTITGTFGDPATVDVTSVTADSRRCTEGSLFVAITGFKADGAAFIDSAVRKGAVAIVTERAGKEAPVVTIETSDAREALSIIAANFYGCPADKLDLIGVTGTSGKTTTTKMVESILDATGEPAGLIGTIEYRAGEERMIADRTTPDAIVLQEWLGKMVQAGVTRAVAEVSSHALALKRTHGIQFAAAVFTNISRDHFDFHRDFEDYYAAKRMLFDQIDKSRRTAIVNIDDDFGRRLANELGRSVAITFGRSEDADIYPSNDFVASDRGLRGRLTTPSGEVMIDSPLLGLPNLYNWMGAIGAAQVVGIDNRTIEEGVRDLRTVRGRFERVGGESDGSILVDYAHKPDALDKLLRAVREMAPSKRLVVIFGCGGDRDRGKRPEMGEIAGRLADLTILTCDNPRSEDPEAILDEIEGGIKKSGRAQYERIADRRQAIARGVELSGPDSVVVVAGKGHETYQVVGDQVVHFDDREEIELALQKRKEITTEKKN